MEKTKDRAITCVPCENIGQELDPDSNIENCYYCTKDGCGCENDRQYLDVLVSKITKELLDKISS